MEDKSYIIPNHVIPGFKISDYLKFLKQFDSFIQEQNIETKNTRIERYIKYLELVILKSDTITISDIKIIFKNSIDDRFQHCSDWYLYILREVHELIWIFKGLQNKIPIGLNEKLKMIVSGRDFAALDKNSTSRDIQFELRIASYFCQAGCKVDISQKTDIIVHTKKQIFYIECKRVSNKNQLKSKLSEARKQLATKMPKKYGNFTLLGCIAIDVTKAAFAHNGLTFSLVNDHSKDIIQDKLQEFLKEQCIADLYNNDKSIVGNLWLQIHIPSLIYFPKAQYITRFSSLQHGKPFISMRQKKALKKFYSIYEVVSKMPLFDLPKIT